MWERLAAETVSHHAHVRPHHVRVAIRTVVNADVVTIERCAFPASVGVGLEEQRVGRVRRRDAHGRFREQTRRANRERRVIQVAWLRSCRVVSNSSRTSRSRSSSPPCAGDPWDRPRYVARCSEPSYRNRAGYSRPCRCGGSAIDDGGQTTGRSDASRADPFDRSVEHGCPRARHRGPMLGRPAPPAVGAAINMITAAVATLVETRLPGPPLPAATPPARSRSAARNAHRPHHHMTRRGRRGGQAAPDAAAQAASSRSGLKTAFGMYAAAPHSAARGAYSSSSYVESNSTTTAFDPSPAPARI